MKRPNVRGWFVIANAHGIICFSFVRSIFGWVDLVQAINALNKVNLKHVMAYSIIYFLFLSVECSRNGKKFILRAIKMATKSECFLILN